MERTLTRFSPEPRAAVHLPLQSGASVMQGDSDETTDRRRDERDCFWRQADSILIKGGWRGWNGQGCPSVAALVSMVQMKEK